MDAVVEFLSSLFWGILTLSLLVFIHEGGHFLAARACGVRVTEFFLGLPSRWRVGHVSKRIGTTFGVTPLLLGGYAAICGMEDVEVPCAPRVLSLVHRRGTMDVSDIAHELSITEDEATEACAFLMGWGSLAGVYQSGESAANYPTTYASQPRDAAGNTIFDGRCFDRAHATAQGDPWEPTLDEKAFFEQERSRTYIGKGFWKRAFMLLAGIIVNIVCAVVLVMGVYSIIGVDVAKNTNVLGSVTENSPAEKAGLTRGDAIMSINGVKTDTWTALYEAIHNVEQGDIQVVYRHEGATKTAVISPNEDGTIGIGASYERVRLNPIESARISFDYLFQTASGVLKLIQPAHTKEILDQSTSVVGISVLSAQAASAGVSSYLTFAALVSLSLGFMNLLPIPPLDGGKLLIEIIQALTRRKIPMRTQEIISMVGVGLFVLLFIYMLRTDILRLI